MAWAEIFNGLVYHIGAQSEGRIECAPEVQVGWSYDGEVFRAPPAPPMPELNRKQWVFLQYQPEIAPLFEAVEATLKVADPIQYAALMAYKESDGAVWSVTFQLIGSFAPFLPEGVELTEAFLAPLWLRAASF